MALAAEWSNNVPLAVTAGIQSGLYPLQGHQLCTTWNYFREASIFVTAT
jgi:hypothetical protein